MLLQYLYCLQPELGQSALARRRAPIKFSTLLNFLIVSAYVQAKRYKSWQQCEEQLQGTRRKAGLNFIVYFYV